MVGFLANRCKQHCFSYGAGAITWVLVAGLVGLTGCSQDSYQSVHGATMGTYYRVQADCPVAVAGDVIDGRLRDFNAVFSTYEPASELSQFNMAADHQWRPVSDRFMAVLLAAQTLVDQSAGAFDPTVGGLVNLWGFGPDEAGRVPSEQQLTQARASTGFAAFQLDPGVPAVRVSSPRTLDLSAIAKGRAVDELIEWLARLDCASALVDIGGEIRVFGESPSRRAWRLAIEQPGQLSANADPLPVIVIQSGAVATSGDYRNYRELAGRRVSHLIDPRTARPITHGLASVTVWHPEAMWADGYATAISVLGPAEGQRLANQAKLAVAMLIRTSDGQFEPWMSEAFRARFAPRQQGS